MNFRILLTLLFALSLNAQDEPPLIKDKEGKISIGTVQEDTVKVEVTKEKQISTNTSGEDASVNSAAPQSDQSPTPTNPKELSPPSTEKVTKEKEVAVSTLISNKTILQISAQEADQFLRNQK